ncbi:MAG: hypothetical protein LBV55_03665 [Acholeplasmatales bacterium]|jgi:hypothetical protein|nr:hypothetical protein [Acholeplasmatales bacterium]
MVFGPNGWEEYSDYSSTLINFNNVLTFEIGGYYKIILQNPSEPVLFNEYYFVIDKVIPDFWVSTEFGIIELESLTISPFKISWDEEGVTITYKNSLDNFLNNFVYSKNEYILISATYNFTLTDYVGNQEFWTITLDGIVAYHINGDFVSAGQNFHISKNNLVLIFEEPILFLNISLNGTVISLEAPYNMRKEGTYIINCEDYNGNFLILTVIIDRTSPIINLYGNFIELVTNERVIVEFLDFHVAYLNSINGTHLQEINNLYEVTAEGIYYIEAFDLAGNSSHINFEIKKSVRYIINITNNSLTTEAVILQPLEAIY